MHINFHECHDIQYSFGSFNTCSLLLLREVYQPNVHESRPLAVSNDTSYVYTRPGPGYLNKTSAALVPLLIARPPVTSTMGAGYPLCALVKLR